MPIGDTGPDTAAQRAGAEIVALDGPNPVRRKQRVKDVLKRMVMQDQSLSMRQYQAARAIQSAAEKKKPGGGGNYEPRVDCSRSTSNAMDAKIDATRRVDDAQKVIPKEMRFVVDWVCVQNKAISELSKGRMHGMHKANLQVALDLVANRLGY